MAPIEDWDREEVNHSEVDTENGHEQDKTHQPSSGLFSSHLSDQDRATDCFRWNDPLNEFHNAHDGQFNALPGLKDSLPHSHQGADLADQDFLGGRDSDHENGFLFSEEVFHFGGLRSHLCFDGVTLPFQAKGQFFPPTVANDPGEIIPRRDIFSINRLNDIPFSEARLFRRKARANASDRGRKGKECRRG